MGKAGITGAAIRFGGIVQGVGFRPLVYRRALSFNLKGFIQNTDTGVLVKVDGTEKAIRSFYDDILTSPPVLAQIHSSSIDLGNSHGFENFVIIKSEEEGEGFTPISPDVATCGACRKEIINPADRRYRYAFTNCTDCGPRFTIIRSIPYDRKYTTMSVFPMCSRCSEEYEDPLDRRYHAQPNACPDCGPELKLLEHDGMLVDGDPIESSAKLLEVGKIIAVKGLGGYHLAVSPKKKEWVERLRKRKRRPGKPFALMVRNLDVARKYCRIGEVEEQLLLSSERPIVLLEKASDGQYLPRETAPDTELVGLMLPYTPIHHILMEEGPEILIMTSANMTEEPLAYQDEDASRSLGGIADGFLTHNRDIQRPCDDSVIGVVEGRIVPIRRSRGYVPRMVDADFLDRQLLAAGASEKNTFCVFKDGKAFMSHHIGDLNNVKSIDAYTNGIRDFLDMFRVTPEAVVCDLHPDYESTRYAEKIAEQWGVPLFRVQHHHAHIAAVLGEKGVSQKVIGVAFDGTGYGDDETVWGGEFLIADAATYERAGHYAPVPMPGGEKSILETDRMAVAYLISSYGSSSKIPKFRLVEEIGQRRLHVLEELIGAGVNTPLTSSCGRLFDAVSALLGLCVKPLYDAQGAILLETEAHGLDELVEPYPYYLDPDLVLHFRPMIHSIVRDIVNGVSSKNIARRFHLTVILSGVEVCKKLREKTGIEVVALGGGVFQNRLVLEHFIRVLERNGFSVLINSLVPPNDGGISLGQGVAALKLMEGGSE
jgi:hydrogenase maturation protein HypF